MLSDQKNKHLKRIALFLSYAFHPLFMPIYGILLLLILHIPITTDNHQSIPTKLGFDVILLTIVIPLLSVIMMVQRQLISSIALRKKEERFYPYLVTLLAYSFAFILMKLTNINPLILDALTGVILCLLLIMIITFFWKISAHTAGIGGVIGLYIVLIQAYSVNLYPLYLLFIVALFIAFSRYILRCHTLLQLLFGGILGSACVLIMATDMLQKNF